VSIVVAFLALTMALTNLVTWRPLSRRALARSTLSWALAWAPSEFPVATLVTQAAIAIVLVVIGGADAWYGVAGLVVLVLSWSFLLAALRDVLAAPRVLDAALVAGLGRDYASRAVHPRPAPTSRVSALQIARAHRSYAVAPDLSYGPAGPHNLLDVWRSPETSADGKAPVLLQLPGGAWTQGKRTGQAYPLMTRLCDRGWVCVAINYRLSPADLWPAHINDVKRAIAWVKEHIAEHGGDPDFVVVTGGSAGGHLSSLAALTADDPSFQSGFEAVDTSVAAAVSLYPNTDWTDRDDLGHSMGVVHLERNVVRQKLAEAFDIYDAASPRSRASDAAPPFFVAHGRNDSLIPVELSHAFAARLREVSRNPVVFADLPGAQHAFDILASRRTRATVTAVESFLGVVYAEANLTPDVRGNS